MKITVNDGGAIQLEEVYNGVLLKTNSGEYMSICMRDTGFEFTYQGKKYLAQNGHIEKLSIRGHIFTGEHNEDTVTSCHPER